MRKKVTVELDDHDIDVLDSLVRGGVGDSRAGALAWCVRHFKEKEPDWLSHFSAIFSAAAVDTTVLQAKATDEKRLVHRVATRVGNRLDQEIMATPSGELRNLLVDASLIIDVYRNGSIQSVLRRLEAAAKERNV